MNIASIGIDLGKTTFHLVALGERSKVLIRKKFSRAQLLAIWDCKRDAGAQETASRSCISVKRANVVGARRTAHSGTIRDRL